MSVSLLFALVGGIILVGFLANLLFRLTRVPSVLLLIGIGVILGPLTGWIHGDALLAIAPYFGAAALLVILFEGGLELEIAHVVRHAPRTALLALVVFGLSLASVAALAHGVLGLPLLQALMLGAILGATSPAVCMPVVSGLSLRPDVKTVIKLESVMGEVLLIVTVVLLVESHATGATGIGGWLGAFARSLVVATLVASIAGVLWSRLVGWMGREPLSYMLTLGMVCLLYFAVEELGGSPAIAILLFGLILANMQSIAGRFGPRFRELFGIDVREEQFVLSQFMVNITAELSFLVRTFFFVYLGLLMELPALSWALAGWTAVLYGLLLASRRIGLGLVRGVAGSSQAERQAIMALQPRGLATAVVAFLPMQAGIPGTDRFPLYAFVIIVLSNLYMTGGVLLAERRLRQTTPAGPTPLETSEPVPEAAWTPTGNQVLEAAELALPAEPAVPSSRRTSPFSPASDFADEADPSTFTDWMARFFGLRRADREVEYAEMIRASYLSEPLFWVQAALGAAICALGLILNQTAIVIGGALIVPLVRPVIATGLALAAGDLYLLAKLLLKLLGFAALAILMSAALIDLLPFGVTTSEIAGRTSPTILDFLVALFGGMSGAALISLRRRAFSYLPGAVIAITLLPALCVMGFGFVDSLGGPIFRGGALQFTANLFAAVLGAGAILILVGIPRAAQSPSIQQWKEAELATPFTQALFGRLGLQHVIGRTGSVRARLVVVGVFLLSLLIPLQLALNQLTMEFRTRQAISRAQTIFDVPGRSSVIESSFAVRGETIDVRLQVVTNALYSANDITRFEERVADQAGHRARLDLVQTLGDIGNADTIRGLLTRPEPAPPVTHARSVSDSLQDVGAIVRQVLAEIPLPESAHVVTVRGDISGSPDAGVELVYLADEELGTDARGILTRLLSSRTRVGADRVTLRWVPGAWPVPLTGGGAIDGRADETLRRLRGTLAEHPDLAAVLEPPRRLAPAKAEMVLQQLQQRVEAPDLSIQEAPSQSDGRDAVVRLRLRSRLP